MVDFCSSSFCFLLLNPNLSIELILVAMLHILCSLQTRAHSDSALCRTMDTALITTEPLPMIRLPMIMQALDKSWLHSTLALTIITTRTTILLIHLKMPHKGTVTLHMTILMIHLKMLHKATMTLHMTILMIHLEMLHKTTITSHLTILTIHLEMPHKGTIIISHSTIHMDVMNLKRMMTASLASPASLQCTQTRPTGWSVTISIRHGSTLQIQKSWLFLAVCIVLSYSKSYLSYLQHSVPQLEQFACSLPTCILSSFSPASWFLPWASVNRLRHAVFKNAVRRSSC